ncbi:hypothetical protein BT93_A0168 [Corymbia citriodora subsp. variegata]|nr:hypothetical protein BT93_A0168 [Corymbia citriodora subsp. variegata]
MALGSIWDVWNEWNIRGSVILSLLLQIFLILFAPLRKKIANQCLDFLLWLSYLMADWVAAFGIGLISHNQGNSSTQTGEVDKVLQVFWASFLLLHLGGPDTISAFSLEDSSLWSRHLLNIIFQICAAIYVFVQIFSSDKSLMIPTITVFLAGVIKSAERIWALYLSSFPRLQDGMLSWEFDSVDGLEESVGGLDDIGNKYFDEKEANIVESIVVKHAYILFRTIRVFLGDLIFTWKQREMNRRYFLNVSAMDALRVISIELQFMYEELHTKALAIRSKWSYIFRFIAFINVVIAFILFNHSKKHRLSNLDVEITYSLLFGGIVLDVIALIMWCNIGSSKLNSIFHKLVSATNHLRKPRFAPCEAKRNTSLAYEVLDTPLIFRRWSESISACNLLSISTEIYDSLQRLHFSASYKNCSFPWKIIDSIHVAVSPGPNLSRNPFIKELWIFIFEEVKCKSQKLDDTTEVRKIFETRGDRFLKSKLGGIDCNNLLRYITKLNYGDSIIIWHIATDIWYNIEEPLIRNNRREFSKILSDYMLYLLIKQSILMSPVACDAQLTADRVTRKVVKYCGYNDYYDIKSLCMGLFEQNYTKPPLGAGIRLALEMANLGERKWEVMSGVWVEMLSYAAVHIKGEAHVKVLSKGGELLAFVWLLMAHFGCSYRLDRGMYWEDWKTKFQEFEPDEPDDE